MKSLRLGFISYIELSSWFGSKSPMQYLKNPQTRVKKLIELKHYAIFDVLEENGGIDIKTIKIPFYLKRTKKRDKLYSKYINKVIKSKPYLTKEEIINYCVSYQNEIGDEKELIEYYVKDRLQDYPQYTVYGDPNGKPLTQEQRDYLQSEQNKNGPTDSEGMTVKAYNFLVGRAQTIARYSFIEKYGFSPKELGVHYERVTS